MRVMPPAVRKAALVIHIISSVGWLGAIAGFLALAVAGLTAADPQLARATYLGMNLIGWTIIFPLSLASLVTGLVQALGTVWGLFRHYWVLIKLIITALATVLLLVHLQPVTTMADMALSTDLGPLDMNAMRGPAGLRRSSSDAGAVGHNGAVGLQTPRSHPGTATPKQLPGLNGEYGKQWRVDVPEDNPAVRFIMVSPGIDFKDGEPLNYSRESERLRWTADAIDQARSEGIPWTVVGMHTLCFSVGEKRCDARKAFTNMLIDKKVNLVLSAHDHLYQRSHQVELGASCPELVPNKFSASCVSDKDGGMMQGGGTVFVTVGVGGVGLYDVKNKDPECRLLLNLVRQESESRARHPGRHCRRGATHRTVRSS